MRSIIIILASLFTFFAGTMYGVLACWESLKYSQSMIDSQSGKIEILQEQLAKAHHDNDHLYQAEMKYYAEWQNAIQELIDAGVYKETFKVESPLGWITSFEKSLYKP